MANHRVELNPEKNRDYSSLITRQDKIVEELNTVKTRVHEYKIEKLQIWRLTIPCITPFNASQKKKNLSLIGNDIVKLQKTYIQWTKDAWNFCDSPKFRLDGNSELENFLTTILLHNFLLNLISALNADMTLLSSDYNLRCEEVENTINYSIAITGWFFIFISLINALIGLFLAL